MLKTAASLDFEAGLTRSIRVRMTDGGGLSTEKAFTITVIPTPEITAIADITILEDAATQTVNLSGISGGGGESQPLRVTATSSNPGLIPNPAITYASPDGTGSIKVQVKRILRKYGYPPDLQAEAVKTVLMQAESLCRDWAE
jgi:hypothetical protein